MRRLCAAIALCALTTPYALAQARPLPSRGELEAFVDGIVEAELAKNDVAGAVVAIVANGEVAFVKGYGFADVAKRTPVDEHTLFRMASISKLFTALAVLQLAEQGKLDLDADVNAYLDFAIPPARGKPVTLRQLLTHRAGFEEQVRDLGSPAPPAQPLAQFARTHLPRRTFEPEKWPSYSNYGVALAGYIAERTSGVPFGQLVLASVFAPLGMDATFEQPLPARLVPRLSQGYSVASKPPGPFEVIHDAPAGALTASGAAMGRFMRMLLGRGALDGSRVLSPEGFARWVEPQVTIAGNALGLAIMESRPHGVRLFGHGGDLSHFHSELAVSPEHGLGVFVAQNSLGNGGRLLRQALVPALVKRYFAERRREQPKAIEPGHAHEVAGSYMTTRRSDHSLTRVLGLLGQTRVTALDAHTVEAEGLADAAGNTRKWREVAPYRFRSEDGELEIEFARDAAGRVTHVLPWFPGLTFERARGTDTLRFALALLVPALGIALATLLVPLAGRLARRALAAPPAPPRPRAQRLLFGAAAALWLGALVAILAFSGTAASEFWMFSRGNDTPLLVAVGAVWLAAALSFACIPLAWRAARGATLSRWRRFGRVLPVLAFLALTWFAWNWGLLSNPTRY
jgi:CubicO group peptidase (beta-lactamase class C family)